MLLNKLGLAMWTQNGEGDYEVKSRRLWTGQKNWGLIFWEEGSHFVELGIRQGWLLQTTGSCMHLLQRAEQPQNS